MTEWFQCKVRYDKTVEDGQIKSTNEVYLVDALSFTEAEKRFIEEITPQVSGDFVVTDIKRAKIAELFESNDSLADRWFKARVAFLSIDEKTETEKRSRQLSSAVRFFHVGPPLLPYLASNSSTVTGREK